MRRPGGRLGVRRLVRVAGLALLALGAPVRAQESTPVDFDRDIRPLLSAKCFRCHGPDGEHRKAGLRLDTWAGVTAVGKRGAAVVPGEPERSLLVQRIAHADPRERMPPPRAGEPLDAAERERLIRWIEQGAPWAQHWAFVPPAATTPPGGAPPGSEIDAFVRARLAERGMQPAPAADRARLLRRVTLDLTGLPPAPHELDAFLADTGATAYERVVDRLLASPRYGEHMARFWLDAARYGDTHGLHLDNYREMWPYRDWVIDAFNRNLPYDAFVTEQLAGDLLPDATLEQQIASGFNRCHVTTNEGGSIVEEVYVRNVVDRVSTVGTAMMGLTVGCAVCHDHKFDPITQRDFYAMFAFFNNLDGKAMDDNAAQHHPVVRVPSAEQAAALAALEAERTAAETAVVALVDAHEYSEPVAAAPAAPRREVVWIDDALPPGAEAEGDGLEWVEAPRALVHSGRLAMQRRSRGLQQHSFRRADVKLRVGSGDVLFAWVRVDPRDPPRAIMLQWNGDGQDDWDHRAFWGEDVIDYGESGTAARFPAGPLPRPGVWTRLEVPAAAVGFAPGAAVHGLAITQFDGTSQWDAIGAETSAPQDAEDHVWIDDALPRGAVPGGDGQTWSFGAAGAQPVLRGGLSLRRSGGDGLNQDYFTGARPLRIQHGDRLFAHVWLDAEDPPRGVQLQFHSGGWGHRARWGVEAHGAGAEGGADFVAGPLPPRGRWVRLEVGVEDVGLRPGARVDGWAFTQVGGTVYWDAAGVRTFGPPDARARTSLRAWTEVAAADASLPQPLREAAAAAAPSVDQRQLLRRHYLRHEYVPLRAEVEPLQRAVDAVLKQLDALEAEVPTTLVMAERDEPRPAYVLVRGEYDARGEQVEPAIPAALPPMGSDLPRDRLGFARWLTDGRHPLTARVFVNRLWQQLFGTGLVETAEDFGNQGARPTHPRLLDWLACRFVADGWDVKRMLRRMVLSETYAQTSSAAPEVLARDPNNRWLARGPRHRLDAEVLRDAALAYADLLVERIGGPGVKPPQPAGLWKAVGYVGSNTAEFTADQGADKVHRRSIYTFFKRTAPPPQLSTFDAPSREVCVVRRERTNTPLQALLLMNDPQFVEASRGVARRVLSAHGAAGDEAVAEALLRLVLCRPVDPADCDDVLALLRSERAAFAAAPDRAAALLSIGAVSIGEEPPELAFDAIELAAWTLVASTVLNTHEAVTKS